MRINGEMTELVEGARLESVCRGNSTEGSNPSLSAIYKHIQYIYSEAYMRGNPVTQAKINMATGLFFYHDRQI